MTYNDTEGFVAGLSLFKSRDPRWLNMGEFLLKYGRKFEWRKDMQKAKAGIIKECYRNAGLLSYPKSKQLIYCEGYAYCGTIPVLHAWCATEDGFVIDNTWTPRRFNGETREYFGVQFNWKFRNQCMKRTQCWGILPEPEIVSLLFRFHHKLNWQYKTNQ